MSISICIVCTNEWEKYTRPLLDSIFAVENNPNIHLLDNASIPPVPPMYDTGVIKYRFNKKYPMAITRNYLVEMVYRDSDWVVFMDSDTLVRKPFLKNIEGLDPKKQYGLGLGMLEQHNKDYQEYHHVLLLGRQSFHYAIDHIYYQGLRIFSLFEIKLITFELLTFYH